MVLDLLGVVLKRSWRCEGAGVWSWLWLEYKAVLDSTWQTSPLSG